MGMDRRYFLGFNSSPKLPDPQMYKLPYLSIAPEWYPAVTFTTSLNYLITVGLYSFILWPVPS
jgi:hypothetical protein